MFYFFTVNTNPNQLIPLLLGKYEEIKHEPYSLRGASGGDGRRW